MFSNLKKGGKNEKISSGRVQVCGSSSRDPWGSFVGRPLTYSLKSHPGELGGSGQLTALPSVLLCVPRVTA